jgi:hypothetical protein
MQDQMVTESMGHIVDRTRENLAPSDMMISRTRRLLMNAARAYSNDGTLPSSAKNPEHYSNVRGGQLITQEGADWVKAYSNHVAAAPLQIGDPLARHSDKPG